MKNLIYIISVLLITASCDKMLLEDETPNTAEENFEYFWDVCNRHYGLFRVKNIDWDLVYQQYRPGINETTTQKELYNILVEILGMFNDGHTALVPTDSKFPMFNSGIYGAIDSINDFDLEVVKENYLKDIKDYEGIYTYGKLDENIGYIYIDGFGELKKFHSKAMDEILSELKDSKGIVFDLRGGYGGEDLAGQEIAGHFADDTYLYMTNRIKNGPGHDDFSATYEWYVEPTGDFQYTKPVILLTHRITISARETFGLAMKVLPNVTFVGDTSAGAFSNTGLAELPNGWILNYSIGEWFAGDGTSYEGVGLPPDVVVLNDKEELLAGKDRMLERAVGMLR